MAEYAVGGSPYLGGDCGTCEGGNEVTGGGLHPERMLDYSKSVLGAVLAFLKVAVLIGLILMFMIIGISNLGSNEMLVYAIMIAVYVVSDFIETYVDIKVVY